MSDIAVGAVIVRHIDELEAALRYATATMEPMLEKAVTSVLDDKRLELGWAGEMPADFEDNQWLAPEEWRMSGNARDDEFYLSFVLDTVPSIDGHVPETWIGTIAGFAGAGLTLSARTDALGQRPWKTLMKTQAGILEELANAGFRCDLRNGEIAVSISIDRESLAAGFEDDALEQALEPIALAVDRISAARPALDRLVRAIKQSLAG